MLKSDMLTTLSNRHAINRERIRAFKAKRNVDGSEISKGHAATALSNARREQLLIELLMEVLAISDVKEYNLSERADQGFQKLTMPLERHYSKCGE